ncbi:hypothetical protein ACFPER_05600 [Agromyces aurantiacus]|uniref:WYL domain-containing protein n=1 Tax=Agromyces aurantiacus TaxID=165814 RepID=A0ABV9R4J0_9MICO|nr:hypothetical protein [Agromyces aurantiacus]MBM7502933.1 hypothetical protein [Agromyces aurantiacus]
MTDDATQEELRRLLGRSTRHGMYTSLATRAGLPLPSVRSGFRLSVDSVEQVVQDTTPTDVSRWINALYVKRVEDLPLDAADLFKLRVLLLFGLGQARYLKAEERRLALARTYRISALSGENPSLGAHQFRNRASDVFRAERDQLIGETARLVSSSIVQVTPNEARKTSPSAAIMASNDYRIVDYDDQHIYPASGAHERSVIRRRTIKALRDGVNQFRAQYTLTSVRGVIPRPRIVGIGQLTIEHARPHEENGQSGERYDLVINFPPLKKDQTRVLQWVVEREQQPTRAGGSGIQVAGVTPAVAIDHATISMRFESSVLPARCWRFDSVEPGDASLEELGSGELRMQSGYVSAEWDQPLTGRASGIAWRW